MKNTNINIANNILPPDPQTFLAAKISVAAVSVLKNPV